MAATRTGLLKPTNGYEKNIQKCDNYLDRQRTRGIRTSFRQYLTMSFFLDILNTSQREDIHCIYSIKGDYSQIKKKQFNPAGTCQTKSFILPKKGNFLFHNRQSIAIVPTMKKSNNTKRTKFIFVTGGVLSSLGKGLASAAIGALLESRGLTVTFQKLDPYINVDPGTMNPFQHGEVYVTDDGG